MTTGIKSRAVDRFKQVRKILKAQSIDMGGFPVKQALPLQDIDMLDPFLLLHHARVEFQPDQKAIHQGVGPHPHRGFSPVTFVVEGQVHHRDSHGNDQVASEGEVQWMNAGAGLIHSERPTQKIIDEAIPQEIIQLWINTPAAVKMRPPEYQFLTREEMPVIPSGDGLIENRLIAGSYRGTFQKKIRTESGLMILWGKGMTGGLEELTIPESYNVMVYLIKGKMFLNQVVMEKETLMIFDRMGDELSLEILADAEFLILGGEPINERIAQHGPFVMNTRTEILEAMRDYQMGKMGVLIEEY